MPNQPTHVRAILAVTAAAVIALLFIASYEGALHDPTPHHVPLAVSTGVPPRLVTRLADSPEVKVQEVDTPADAQQRIDERKAYGALLSENGTLHIVVAPAASLAIAEFLRRDLAPQLGQSGARVVDDVVHPLPKSDVRGLAVFYAGVGLMIAGYLGATLLTLMLGEQKTRRDFLLRLAALLGLAVIVGSAGAWIAYAIDGLTHGFLLLAAFSVLTVLAAGLATVFFQSMLGLAGTGVAILLFVVVGNPAAGGAAAYDMTPGLWRVLGPLLPNGAFTTAARNTVYFPDAPVTGPLLVLLAWAAIPIAAALLLTARTRRLARARGTASIARVADARP